jgi:AraC family transcriptional regulator
MAQADTGMNLLGHLNSQSGVGIFAVRGVLNNQQENVVEIQDSVISLILSHPTEFVSRRGGSSFRPINPLNFCAAGSTFQMRADGPMTVASCVFGRGFLRDLEEMEEGLCLSRLDIVSGISSQRITELCLSMFREALMPGFASSIFAEATGTMIALEIARYNGGRSLDQSRGGLAPWQLRRLEDYLQANLSDDLSLEKLARLMNMSARHLSRGVRRAKGVTIQQWIARERLQKARRLLSQGDLPINLIANQAGFQTAAAFATAFKAVMGCTPSQFRKVSIN